MGQGITIIGLGPGNSHFLTQEARDLLSRTQEIYLRTGLHPIVEELPKNLSVNTFDDVYDEMKDFESVYQTIVQKVVELARRPGGVLYGVPGDPTVGEVTVAALRRAAATEGLPCRIVHGLSFVEPCLDLMEVDALDGLQIADALELASRHHPPFHPDAPALIGQLYNRMIAADVKLTLMNQYPDDHSVALLHEVGTSEGSVERLALHSIDRSDRIGDLTALFVPPLGVQSAFESFQETVAHLRAPDGCPWDREQTHQTLRAHLMEEAYEALNAIDNLDMTALQEELGDLLLQIVLQAQIATEEGTFTMADVVATIQDKIIRRHPHVFEELQVEDLKQVLHNWEALKADERADHGTDKGLLDGVPLNLPALAQASEIQSRVVRVGFDWSEIEGVVAKIHEELQEVAQAEDLETRAAEIGDLLFAVVNYARWLEVDAEASLRQANTRFRRRFQHLEEEAHKQGRKLTEMTLEEMDTLWDETKSGGEA
ncbi:MAG: nucleoside triphosphate pyrophosphohydrolase [Anaerolineales bacterium]|nr:nucleoside triphosphate pyrophosphohydrolase [Anaerolineales bacterium]